MMARPLCRYCGKPIPKRFTHTSLRLTSLPEAGGFRMVDAYPTTEEEAQRMVNEPVVTVRRKGYGPDADGIVDIKSWDGESYISEHFCKDRCATDFGYMVARDRPNLGSDTWVKAREKQRAKESAAT